jgi:hypothetical protein
MTAADPIQLARRVAADRRKAHEINPPNDDAPGYDAYPESADGEPDYEPASAGQRQQTDVEPLALVTPLDWPDEAPPPVDWLADGRIPRGDVTTLHGDGGAGKTDIACQLAEACVRRAPYWLGHEVAPGPFVVISA